MCCASFPFNPLAVPEERRAENHRETKEPEGKSSSERQRIKKTDPDRGDTLLYRRMDIRSLYPIAGHGRVQLGV